jgi:SAM-dependent methyltransferase
VTHGHLGGIYAHRFDSEAAAAKNGVWREVVRYLQRWVPSTGAVLDVACDEGYFIRNIQAAERWASDVRDVSHSLASGVRFVAVDAREISGSVPHDHFDVVFMSNYLEHLPSSMDVMRQMRDVSRILRPGGRLIVLQPNIRYVGAAYWDFIDHQTPLTEHSLAEAARLAGLEIEKVIPRFLPYTTKSRLPQHPLLVRWYLKLPLAWRIMGRQTLLIARRPR